MFTVIETGGKQYVASPGDKIKVEKLAVQEGEEISLEKVLFRETDSGVEIGKPYLDGSTVKAKVLRQGRSDKKIVFKFHSKNRYHKKKTHRQAFTELEITSIV
jgi:large subunit ribosomal protein L21